MQRLPKATDVYWFTSVAFTGALAEAGVAISMDGRGRWMDNVFIERLWRSMKYEDIYLKGYADGRQAARGIAEWIAFYNERRPHQALTDRAPMAVWREAIAGAEAVDMMDNGGPATRVHFRPIQRQIVSRGKALAGKSATARRRASEILRLANEGTKREEIAKRVGVGVASVYRVLAEQKGAHAKVHAARIQKNLLSRVTLLSPSSLILSSLFGQVGSQRAARPRFRSTGRCLRKPNTRRDGWKRWTNDI